MRLRHYTHKKQKTKRYRTTRTMTSICDHEGDSEGSLFIDKLSSEESALQYGAPLTLFLSRITGGDKRLVTTIVYDNARGAHPSLRISRRRRDQVAANNTSDYDSDANDEYNSASRLVDSLLTPPQRRLSSLGSSCSSIAMAQLTTGSSTPECGDSMDHSGSWIPGNRWGEEDGYGSARQVRKVCPPSPPLSPVRRRFKSHAGS